MLIPCVIRGKLILKLFLKWKDFNRDILIKFLSFTWLTNFSRFTETYINLRHLLICQIWLKLAKDPESILGNRQMFTLGNALYMVVYIHCITCITKWYGNYLKNESFLLTPNGKGLSVLTDQEYFFPGHIHKALASALSKEHVCVYSLLLLENTGSADRGWLVLSKARKQNQFLNVHRVKHLQTWHITSEEGKKKNESICRRKKNAG